MAEITAEQLETAMTELASSFGYTCVPGTLVYQKVIAARRTLIPDPVLEPGLWWAVVKDHGVCILVVPPKATTVTNLLTIFGKVPSEGFHCSRLSIDDGKIERWLGKVTPPDATEAIV